MEALCNYDGLEVWIVFADGKVDFISLTTKKIKK